MSGRQPRGQGIPNRTTILTRIDIAVQQLDNMVGRWFDGIPAEVRSEIAEIRAPLEDILIRAGVRGRPGGEAQ